MFKYLKSYKSVGHDLERNLSVYYLLNNIPVTFIPNVLSHYQLDSHKTQGLFNNNYNNNITSLSKNIPCSRR